MGIAASSARYLMLLARQSDVEFEGQQLQQSILDLSKQSSELFQQQLDLKPPTAPMESDYIDIEYTFTYTTSDGTPTTTDYRITKWSKLDDDSESYNYSITYGIDGDSNYNPARANIEVNSAGRIIKIYSIENMADDGTFSIPKTDKVLNDEAYENALEDYKYAQIRYDKAYADIQSQLSLVNSQDKMLEMQLNRLDTERTALKTEVETLQKLVKENVERSFKTFGN